MYKKEKIKETKPLVKFSFEIESGFWVKYPYQIEFNLVLFISQTTYYNKLLNKYYFSEAFNEIFICLDSVYWLQNAFKN